MLEKGVKYITTNKTNIIFWLNEDRCLEIDNATLSPVVEYVDKYAEVAYCLANDNYKEYSHKIILYQAISKKFLDIDIEQVRCSPWMCFKESALNKYKAMYGIEADICLEQEFEVVL
jgi:hypothetical protein